MSQGFTHAGFDSGSLATTVHRELFEQTVRLPRRESEVASAARIDSGGTSTKVIVRTIALDSCWAISANFNE